MKKEIKTSKVAALASTAALIGAIGTTANAAELFNYEDLGTGSELRSNLITANAMTSFTSNTDVEFECGEGKCGEGKCGEGKCGEKTDKKDKKKEKSTVKATAEPTKETSNDKQVKEKSSENSDVKKAATKETPKH